MTDSFGYLIKPELDDSTLLRGLASVRNLLDELRKLKPDEVEAGSKGYLATYDDMQNCYAAAITESRRRGLDIPAWEGDELVYSPLVESWITLDGGLHE